jgi:hypothetical protein
MADTRLILALALTAAAASPVLAQAPEGSASTRYCLKVEPYTGSHIERVHCWTRAQWEDQGVDVDKEWRKEGVRVIN